MAFYRKYSEHIPVIVLFLAFLVDNSTIAVLIPILPKILRDMNGGVSEGSSANGTGEDRAGFEQEIGLIAGIGPLAEFFLNPLISFTVRKLGDRTTFSTGSACQIVGVLALMRADRVWLLMTGRVIQSIGSSLSCISGLSLLAIRVEDRNRIKAFNIAISGLTFGYLIGYPMGGLLYQHFGRTLPFGIVLGLSVLDFTLRFLIPAANVAAADEDDQVVRLGGEVRKFVNILKDPYVILTLTLTISCYTMSAVTVATLPNYLNDVSAPQQIGLLYFIATATEALVQLAVSQLIDTHFARVLVIVSAFVCQASALFIMYFTLHVWFYTIPLILLRVGEGLFGAMVTSLLAYVSDTRELKAYNYLYGLFTACFTLGMGMGPILGGYLTTVIGFPTLNLILSGLSVVCIVCSFFLITIRTKPIYISDKRTGLQ